MYSVPGSDIESSKTPAKKRQKSTGGGGGGKSASVKKSASKSASKPRAKPKAGAKKSAKGGTKGATKKKGTDGTHTYTLVMSCRLLRLVGHGMRRRGLVSIMRWASDDPCRSRLTVSCWHADLFATAGAKPAAKKGPRKVSLGELKKANKKGDDEDTEPSEDEPDDDDDSDFSG